MYVHSSLTIRSNTQTDRCSDKDGHIKLSDFGLATGFHKQHDSSYYQRLLENGPSSNGAPARNSVMVNSISLTMTNKDQIATWKANRRKLVRSALLLCIGEYTFTFIPPGLFDCWNTRLYCTWNFPTKRIWERVRLVVTWHHHVRMLSWIPPILLWKHARDISEDNAMATLSGFSRRHTPEQRGWRSYPTVPFNPLQSRKISS